MPTPHTPQHQPVQGIHAQPKPLPLLPTPGPAVLLTLAEAQALLRVSPWMLSRLVNGGGMPSVRIGRRRLITRADLEAFVTGQREEGTRRGW